jgi:hypothetical protein
MLLCEQMAGPRCVTFLKLVVKFKDCPQVFFCSWCVFGLHFGQGQGLVEAGGRPLLLHSPAPAETAGVKVVAPWLG